MLEEECARFRCTKPEKQHGYEESELMEIARLDQVDRHRESDELRTLQRSSTNARTTAESQLLRQIRGELETEIARPASSDRPG